MPTAASDFVGHGRDDGIELLRAVQRDGGDRLGRRLEQCLEFGCAESQYFDFVPDYQGSQLAVRFSQDFLQNFFDMLLFIG